MKTTCIRIFDEVRHTEACARKPHACDHHPDVTASFTNACEASRLHKDAVFFYCLRCAEKYLTGFGRDLYKV